MLKILCKFFCSSKILTFFGIVFVVVTVNAYAATISAIGKDGSYEGTFTTPKFTAKNGYLFVNCLSDKGDVDYISMTYTEHNYGTQHSYGPGAGQGCFGYATYDLDHSNTTQNTVTITLTNPNSMAVQAILSWGIDNSPVGDDDSVSNTTTVQVPAATQCSLSYTPIVNLPDITPGDSWGGRYKIVWDVSGSGALFVDSSDYDSNGGILTNTNGDKISYTLSTENSDTLPTWRDSYWMDDLSELENDTVYWTSTASAMKPGLYKGSLTVDLHCK